jgi:hypothetical protein
MLAFLLCLGIVVASTAVAQDEKPAASDEYPIEHPDFPGVYILEQVQSGDEIQTTLAISVLQDTFLSSGTPNTNYGTATSLNIGWSNSGSPPLNAMRMILQFSLSAIPANATINNATFNIFQTSAIPANDSDFGIQAQFMRQAWGENTVTWNNANFLGSDIIGVGFTNNVSGWKVFDATQVVQTWYSGQRPNFGAIFTGDERPDQNRSRVFYSREQPGSGCGNPFGFGCSPYLVVTFNEANCDTIAPTVSVNPLPQWSPQSFTVTWGGTDTAPPGCPPTGIANYSVQYRINSGAWTDWQNFTTATSAVFNIASNAQFVQFRARARDGVGNVVPWENIGPQASTTVDSVPPNATVNPLPEFSTTSGTITWTGSDNLSGISTYSVQFRVNGGPWEFLVQNVPASQTSFAYFGAPPGFFELRASATDNAGNVQPWGNPQASTTIVGYPVADMNPISPSIITNPAQTTIPLSWTVYPNGYTVTGVQIWYKYGLGSWTLFNTFAGNSGNTSFPINNGDGVYSFEAVALSLTVSEPQTGQAEASVIVDHAGLVVPRAYMPIVANN